jgi:hypothetical protein
MLDAGCWVLGAGYGAYWGCWRVSRWFSAPLKPEPIIHTWRSRMRDGDALSASSSACGLTLGRAVGCRLWVVDCGLWVMCYGLLAVGCCWLSKEGEIKGRKWMKKGM